MSYIRRVSLWFIISFWSCISQGTNACTKAPVNGPTEQDTNVRTKAPINNLEQFEKYCRLGDEYEKKGEWRKAVDAYREALKGNPKNVHGWIRLGEINYRNHRKDEAQKAWLSALAIDPNLADVRWSIGTIYSEKGDDTKALAEYLHTVQIDPKHTGARFNLGSIYLRRGELENAEREYNIMLNIDPSDYSAHDSLGRVFAAKKDWHKAIKEYREALRMASKHEGVGLLFIVYLRLGLAKALKELGRYAEAKKELIADIHYLRPRHLVDERGRRRGLDFPGDPKLYSEIHYELGCIESLEGNIQKALENISAAFSWNATLVDQARSDKHLKKVRATPEFQELLTQTEKRLKK